MPLGYRESLDEFIYDNTFDFNSCFFMKRISNSNCWVQMKKTKLRVLDLTVPFRRLLAYSLEFLINKKFIIHP